MLAAMNMTNTACIYEAFLKGDSYNADTCVSDYPGYTASIIFEVYENQDTTEHTFKIRYRGVHRKIPFCNYAEECPVSTLKKWYNTSIAIDSFNANCGITDPDKNTYLAIAVLEFGVIIIFVIMSLLAYYKKSQ